MPPTSPFSGRARLYYAASLYAWNQPGSRDNAARGIDRLLREDPNVRLDRTQFEAGFVALFDIRRDALAIELERIRQERAEAQQREDAARAERRALAMRLLTEEQRVVEVPLELMFVPLGFNHQALGHPTRAWVFRGLELALAAADLGFFLYYVEALQLRQAHPFNSEVRDQFNTATILAWIPLGATLAALLVDWIWALADYRGTRRTGTVPRPLPPALRTIQISASPSSLGLRLSF